MVFFGDQLEKDIHDSVLRTDFVSTDQFHGAIRDHLAFDGHDGICRCADDGRIGRFSAASDSRSFHRRMVGQMEPQAHHDRSRQLDRPVQPHSGVVLLFRRP